MLAAHWSDLSEGKQSLFVLLSKAMKQSLAVNVHSEPLTVMCFVPMSPKDSLRLMMIITGNTGDNAGVLLKLLISILTSAWMAF